MQRNYVIGFSIEANRDVLQRITQELAFLPELEDKKARVIFMEPLLAYARGHYLSSNVKSYADNIEIFNYFTQLVLDGNMSFGKNMVNVNRYLAEKKFESGDDFLAAVNAAITAYNNYVIRETSLVKRLLENNTKKLIQESTDSLITSSEDRQILKEKLEKKLMSMIAEAFSDWNDAKDRDRFTKLTNDMITVIETEINAVYIPERTKKVQHDVSTICYAAGLFSAGATLAYVAYDNAPAAAIFAMSAGLLLFGSTQTKSMQPKIEPVQFTKGNAPK